MNHGRSIILKSYLCLHISVLLKIVFRSPLLETPTFLSLTSTSKCWVIGLPATPLAERLQHLTHQWWRQLMPTLHAWMGTWKQMSEAWKSRFQLACPPKDIIVFMQVRRHWLSATQQSRGRQTRGKNHHPGHRGGLGRHVGISKSRQDGLQVASPGKVASGRRSDGGHSAGWRQAAWGQLVEGARLWVMKSIQWVKRHF